MTTTAAAVAVPHGGSASLDGSSVASERNNDAPQPVITEIFPQAEFTPTSAPVRIVTDQQLRPEEAASITRHASEIQLVQCQTREEVCKSKRRTYSSARWTGRR